MQPAHLPAYSMRPVHEVHRLVRPNETVRPEAAGKRVAAQAVPHSQQLRAVESKTLFLVWRRRQIFRPETLTNKPGIPTRNCPHPPTSTSVRPEWRPVV